MFAHVGSGSCEGCHLEPRVVLLLYCWGTESQLTSSELFQHGSLFMKLIKVAGRDFSDHEGNITFKAFVRPVSDVFALQLVQKYLLSFGFILITFAKEFSCCLFVCLFVFLSEELRTDYVETWWQGARRAKEEPIPFRTGSGSQGGSMNLISLLLTLWDAIFSVGKSLYLIMLSIKGL